MVRHRRTPLRVHRLTVLVALGLLLLQVLGQLGHSRLHRPTPDPCPELARHLPGTHTDLTRETTHHDCLLCTAVAPPLSLGALAEPIPLPLVPLKECHAPLPTSTALRAPLRHRGPPRAPPSRA